MTDKEVMEIKVDAMVDVVRNLHEASDHLLHMLTLLEARVTVLAERIASLEHVPDGTSKH